MPLWVPELTERVKGLGSDDSTRGKTSMRGKLLAISALGYRQTGTRKEGRRKEASKRKEFGVILENSRKLDVLYHSPLQSILDH